jgi:hypothetical protein
MAVGVRVRATPDDRRQCEQRPQHAMTAADAVRAQVPDEWLRPPRLGGAIDRERSRDRPLVTPRRVRSRAGFADPASGAAGLVHQAARVLLLSQVVRDHSRADRVSRVDRE